MFSRTISIAVWSLVVALVVSLVSAWFIEHSRRQVIETKLSAKTTELNEQINLNKEQRRKLEKYAAIGVKHAKQLSEANQEIDTLSEHLRSTTQRLHVNAVCSEAVRSTSSPRSLGNAKPPRLSETAREDYLRLRRMMLLNNQKIKYLQDYIKTQCLIDDLGPS